MFHAFTPARLCHGREILAAHAFQSRSVFHHKTYGHFLCKTGTWHELLDALVFHGKFTELVPKEKDRIFPFDFQANSRIGRIKLWPYGLQAAGRDRLAGAELQ